jgi:hypothetical protein
MLMRLYFLEGTCLAKAHQNTHRMPEDTNIQIIPDSDTYSYLVFVYNLSTIRTPVVNCLKKNLKLKGSNKFAEFSGCFSNNVSVLRTPFNYILGE